LTTVRWWTTNQLLAPNTNVTNIKEAMISNPHLINQLASQHIADLRREAERARIRRPNRAQQRRSCREAARWMTPNNAKSNGNPGRQDRVVSTSPRHRSSLARIRRGRVHLPITARGAAPLGDHSKR